MWYSSTGLACPHPWQVNKVPGGNAGSDFLAWSIGRRLFPNCRTRSASHGLHRWTRPSARFLSRENSVTGLACLHL